MGNGQGDWCTAEVCIEVTLEQVLEADHTFCRNGIVRQTAEGFYLNSFLMGLQFVSKTMSTVSFII